MKTVHVLKDKDLLEIAGGTFAHFTVKDGDHNQLHFHELPEVDGGVILLIQNHYPSVTFHSDIEVELKIGPLPEGSIIRIEDSGNVPVYVNGTQVY